MTEDRSPRPDTVGLSTKVEEDFVSPLTAIRGSLEILRDFDDLSAVDRERFIERALTGCSRLEKSIKELSKSVYAAARHQNESTATESAREDSEFAERITVHDAENVIEIDLSDFVFNGSALVNAFFDAIDRTIMNLGQRWYIMINQTNCQVWPEAWIAFAHRGKKVRVSLSKGVVRYEISNAVGDGSRTDPRDSDLVDSRAAAWARIAELKAARDG